MRRWVMPYAVTDVARDHMTSLWEPATTALLGRVNAEGLLGDGPRLFDDGLPPGPWTLVSQTAGEHGTLVPVYDRAR